MKRLIKIGIAEDQVLFRQGFVSLLEDEDHLQVVLEVSNGKELINELEFMDQDFPDIIFMDIQMPEMDGLVATEILQKKYPKLKIIALTMHNSDEFIVQMHRRGAHGFLPKDSEFDEVLDAIDMVMNKNKYYNNHSTQVLLENAEKMIRANSVVEDFKTLSHRELEILKLICDDLSNQEIAEKLKVSPRTIEWHRRNIYTKLEVKSVGGLTRYAIENNLI